MRKRARECMCVRKRVGERDISLWDEIRDLMLEREAENGGELKKVSNSKVKCYIHDRDKVKKVNASTTWQR